MSKSGRSRSTKSSTVENEGIASPSFFDSVISLLASKTTAQPSTIYPSHTTNIGMTSLLLSLIYLFITINHTQIYVYIYITV